MTDAPDGEVSIEERSVGFDDREQQDRESPHGEEVRQARNRPLQQLALAGNLDDLSLGGFGEALKGTLRGSTRPDELGQPVKSAAGDRETDDRDSEAEDDAGEHDCVSYVVGGGRAD